MRIITSSRLIILLKLAFISYAYEKPSMLGENKPWIYGSGRYSTELVKALRELGIDVTTFSANMYVRNIGPLAFMLRNSIHNFNKFEIVHSNESSILLTSHPYRIETIHHISSRSSLKDSFMLSILLKSIHNSRHIIVPSNATKEAIIDLDGHIEPDKISVIYHGVNSRIFNNSSVNRAGAEHFRIKYGLEDKFVAINVGRLEKHKRQIDTLKALCGLNKCVLILVGRGGEKNVLTDFAKKNNVDVLHFDYVSDEELAILYNASDAYVHTSLLEGFGMTILEAMACGLPIIAYRVADFEKMIGDAGFLLEPSDFGGIKRYIEVLRQDKNLAKEKGTLAHNKSGEFTWVKSAKEHLRIYEQVLSST